MRSLSQKVQKVVAAAVAWTVLLTALWSGSIPAAADETEICEQPAGYQRRTLFFQQAGDRIWLAFSESDSAQAYCLDATGRVTRQESLPYPILSARAVGEDLYLQELTDTFTIHQLGGETRTVSGWSTDRVTLWDISAAGTVYGVLSNQSTTLATDPTGSAARNYGSRITFLQAEALGQPVVAAGGQLYLGGKSISGSEPMGRIAADGTCLTVDLEVCRLSDSGLSTLYTPEGEPSYFCLDDAGRFYAASGSTVTCTDPQGKSLGSVTLSAAPVALCPAGALLLQNGHFRFAAFGETFVPKLEPTPSPTPTPTPDPSISPSPGPSFPPEPDFPGGPSGEYFLVPAGTTVSDLRQLMWPQAVQITDARGNPLTWGTLATGMFMDDWPLVVPGDCNGSGSVTRADVRTGLDWVLEQFPVDDVFTRAADLNDDGALSAQDLVLLARAATPGS